MSGFSPDWLALREPADHAARSRAVAMAVEEHFRGRDEMTIVDLGCGTGSNLRATMGLLAPFQGWTLVDWDGDLLDAAMDRLAAWADRAEREAGSVQLWREANVVSVAPTQADLNGDLARVLDGSLDLVTAAAFFDLVSAAWIERFASELAARHLPLYTVLTYDGRETWSPPHALDAPVLAAFHAHQGTDKGFGPAAGPKAADVLVQALRRHGYTVVTGDSPWRLGAESRELVRQLAAGIAGAAAETGRVTQAEAKQWAEARAGASAMVGHLDVFAAPPA